jgi:hypothetical protein
MSTISIQVTQGPAQIPPTTPRKTTQVVVTDAGAAVQTFNLDGTESPVGFIPSVTVAPGAGSIAISDLDANGAVIGAAVTVKYTTVAPAAQLASSGATVTVLTP